MHHLAESLGLPLSNPKGNVSIATYDKQIVTSVMETGQGLRVIINGCVQV